MIARRNLDQLISEGTSAQKELTILQAERESLLVAHQRANKCVYGLLIFLLICILVFAVCFNGEFNFNTECVV